MYHKLINTTFCCKKSKKELPILKDVITGNHFSTYPFDR
jgi:hypothetical protein